MVRGRFQYSLSSLLWLTLCCALAISSYLMYRRMAKAERENETLRTSLGYPKEDEPVLVPLNNWTGVTIDVENLVTSVEDWGNGYFGYSYSSKVIFRNHGFKERRLHLPLLRAYFCTSNQSGSDGLKSPWNQEKEIVLQKGESIELITEEKHILHGGEDLFKGRDSRYYGRWALVFGIPEGENPDKYEVGTVLTNPIHWKIDEKCEFQKK